MKACEFAAHILEMVAEYGDHEIGVDGGDAYMDGGVAEAVFVMPSLVNREQGAEPHYLIRWWIGNRPEPNLTVHVSGTEWPW